jgi:hypothetical protein
LFTIYPVTDIGDPPLTSNSNYQRIAEGEHARLRDYPDDLVRKVVTKRVSHSVAERVRRERLNKALQKLAEVLAAAREEGQFNGVYCAVSDGQDQAPPRERVKDEEVTTGSNTKVKIVEIAIEHISSQQKIVREMKANLEDCQQRMASNGDS